MRWIIFFNSWKNTTFAYTIRYPLNKFDTVHHPYRAQRQTTGDYAHSV